MSFARITGTKNGAEALAYALGNGRGHNGHAVRNQYVSSVNMLPPEVESYEAQMGRYWRKAGYKNLTQVRRVVQSFSRRELDPEDPDDILRANLIGQQFVAEAYPGRQAIVCTQIDGKSGLIHNHILINNVSMADCTLRDVSLVGRTYDGGELPKEDVKDVFVPAGYGCIDQQTYHWYVRKHTEDIASRYFELDRGTPQKDRYTQAERTRRAKGKYVWKDDLRERIEAAMAESTDLRDFLKNKLPKHGVSGSDPREPTRTLPEYIVYELIDTSGFGSEPPKKPLKARSHKLGDSYGPEYIRAKLGGQVPEEQVQNEASAPEEDAIRVLEPEPSKVPPEAPENIPEKEKNAPEQGSGGAGNLSDDAPIIRRQRKSPQKPEKPAKIDRPTPQAPAKPPTAAPVPATASAEEKARMEASRREKARLERERDVRIARFKLLAGEMERQGREDEDGYLLP